MSTPTRSEAQAALVAELRLKAIGCESLVSIDVLPGRQANWRDLRDVLERAADALAAPSPAPGDTVTRRGVEDVVAKAVEDVWGCFLLSASGVVDARTAKQKAREGLHREVARLFPAPASEPRPTLPPGYIPKGLIECPACAGAGAVVPAPALVADGSAETLCGHGRRIGHCDWCAKLALSAPAQPAPSATETSAQGTCEYWPNFCEYWPNFDAPKCGAPAVLRYPAMHGGYMLLCKAHGAKHAAYCERWNGSTWQPAPPADAQPTTREAKS